MPLLVPESRKLLLSISAPLALVVASSLGKLFPCEDISPAFSNPRRRGESSSRVPAEEI
jgi:hypothetical protein